MLPSSISLTRFRCFAAEAKLEIRPVTLIFGQNNSGKSALLRALPLLADSAGRDVAPLSVSVTNDMTSPLDLASPAIMEAPYADLRFKGLEADDEQTIGLGFAWKDDFLRGASYTLKEWGLGGQAVIGSLSITGEQSQDIDLHTRTERGERGLVYSLRSPSGEEPTPLPLTFRGLLPETGLNEDEGFPLKPIKELEKRLAYFSKRVRWLGPSRRRAERLRARPQDARIRFAQDGSNATDMLAIGEMVQKGCSGFFVRHFGQELKVLDVAPNYYRTVMVPREDYDIDLIDCGEGPNQVLPVLVMLELARGWKGEVICAIEEPESHLHPSLQVDLAEHICEVARDAPGSRIVVETHSEHFLLGLQLQVAKGLMSPDDVGLAWVQHDPQGASTVLDVRISEDGRLDGNWPPDVFGDQTRVAREILKARRKL